MREKNPKNRQDTARWELAYEMALAGYSRAATSLQTGMSRESCRYLFQSVSRQGYALGRQGRLRSSGRLVRNREEKIQTSLIMVIYGVLGGDTIYKGVQLPILEKAFWLYRALQKTYLMTHWYELDLTDAWSLAWELQHEKAYIKCCRSCQLAYFTSINQYTSVDCPFCLP